MSCAVVVVESDIPEGCSCQYIETSACNALGKAHASQTDMPLQHAADNMLRAMRRQITRIEMEELLQQVRETVPGICLRTTLITGFPGETPDDVEERSVPSNSGSWDLSQLLVTVGMAESKAAARRLIDQGGVSIDGEKQTLANSATPSQTGRSILIKVGKRRFVRVNFS